MTGTLSGYGKDGYYRVLLDKCPPYLLSSKLTSVGTALSNQRETWDAIAAKAMANYNPNNPVVDVPLFFLELKDIPRMVRDLGRYIKRDVSLTDVPGSFLGWSFGWSPLINDLGKMLNFVEATQNRYEYLRRMQHNERFQRSLGSRTLTTSISYRDLAWYGRGTGSAKAHSQTLKWLEEKWYTVDLSLQTPLPSGDQEQLDLARRLVLGLQFRPETLWNAIPWTWLIDWFANFDDLLGTSQGIVKYNHENLNLMRQTTLVTTEPSIGKLPGLSWDEPFTIRCHLKERQVRGVPYALPSFNFPLLNGYQAQIAGALVSNGVFSRL
jgi:hypothetical protein